MLAPAPELLDAVCGRALVLLEAGQLPFLSAGYIVRRVGACHAGVSGEGSHSREALHGWVDSRAAEQSAPRCHCTMTAPLAPCRCAQVWALGSMGVCCHEGLLGSFLGRLQEALERQRRAQHPVLHVPDAARLAWGVAALAAKGLLPAQTASQLQSYWEALMGCLDSSLRWVQLDAASLLRPE